MKVRNKNNYRQMRPMVYSIIILFIMFSLPRFYEAAIVNQNFLTGYGALAGGVAMVLIILIAFLIYPHPKRFPLIMGLIIAFVYIVFSILSQSMDYYYFVMLLAVCLLSMRKDFKLLLKYILLLLVIDISLIIFIVPRYEWMDAYRLITQFFLFIYGSVFILIQTWNIANKEGDAEKSRVSFNSLLESTPNYMLITDEHNHVQYISAPMARFAHLKSWEYAMQRPLIDLFSDKEMKLMFADILDKDGYFETVTTIKLEGEDEERYYKIVSDKLMGERGGRFIDIADITPTVKSRMEAEEARGRADLANSAKSRFLAAMSHEIRTPMNAILGISEIEMARKKIPAETKKAFQNIYNSGDTLLGIINDLLDLSKIDTGKFEINPVRYDMPSLIHDTVQLNIMRIGSKPINFELKVSEAIPMELYGDELRIKQVLNNLLSNAIKYTDKGSVSLEVTSEQKDEDEIVRLTFAVRDTGQGMTKEEVDALLLFEDYSRFNVAANRATEGTGLGLSITKNLVEMMDGDIAVESTPGEGSIFIVNLMQASVSSDAIGKKLANNLERFKFSGIAKSAKLEIAYEPMPDGKVLVVDDVSINLHVARGLMNHYGLEIETAASGFEAIEKIKTGAVYDIVFMDHMMPRMDGIEATKKIREAGYIHPIVALTANAITGQEEMFLNNGFDAFISKPIDVRQLDQELKRFILYKGKPMDEVFEVIKKADVVEAVETVEALETVETVGTVEAVESLETFEEVETEEAIETLEAVGMVETDEEAGTIEAAETPEAVEEAEALEAPEIPAAPEAPAKPPTDDAETMGYFYEDAVVILPAIEELYTRIDTATEEDLENFVINAHGIKSALTYIGKKKASELAYELELAGKERNKAKIKEKTPYLMKTLRSIMESITETTDSE